jgi:hypothetical protein
VQIRGVHKCIKQAIGQRFHCRHNSRFNAGDSISGKWLGDAAWTQMSARTARCSPPPKAPVARRLKI